MVRNLKLPQEDQVQGKDGPSHHSFFNIILEVLAYPIRQEKQTKGVHIGKEDIKLSLFANDMIIYVKNLKELTKKKKTILKLICNYSKVAGYKINIQKSIAFLYINNEHVEFQIKNTILFILAPK